MNRVFVEENKVYSIDLTNAIWATNKLKTTIDNAKIELSDVVFIAETDEGILFIEYKNANIENAAKPEVFNPKDDKTIGRVVRKYYDSLLYINALGKEMSKRKEYIYIVETKNSDSSMRKYLQGRLKAKLPFLFQEQNTFTYKLIDDVQVLSIAEWNEKYPQFSLTKINK